MNTKPFDRRKKPVRQNLLLLPLIWLMCFFVTRLRKFKLKKTDMAGVKPPYLMLCNHQAFEDNFVLPLAAFPHRSNYVSDLEGFLHKEWLCRQIGCLCKRKYTNDLALIKNMKRVIENGDVLALFPEARYCNAGTNSALPASVGKLAKLLRVPVVVLNIYGDYLQSPIWNLKKRRAPLGADMTCILDAEQVVSLPADEINRKINAAFPYDEYRWQREQGIRIAEPWRAEGLHKALYQCPHCFAEHGMQSAGARISCKSCGKEWEMDEYGVLHALQGETEFPHIPDWYEWQRGNVNKEIAQQDYHMASDVLVDWLPNAKRFIPLGKGRLTHGMEGFTLSFTQDGEQKEYHFPPLSMFSLHNEYDYHGKGPGLSLSTLDDTWFLYPTNKSFCVTKALFATDELHRIARERGKAQ